MKEKYPVACYACIIRGDEVLLIREVDGYWKDLWVLPGGSLEMGETLEDCARREAMEEVGCQVEILQQIGAYLSFDPETCFEKQVLLIAYLARYVRGSPLVSTHEREVRWVPFHQIQDLREMNKLPDIIARIIYDARIRAKDWWLR